MFAHLFPRSQRPNCSPRLWSAATPLFALGGGSEENVQYMLGLVALCVAVGLFLGLLSLRARRARRLEGRARHDVVLETLQHVMDVRGRLDMYPVQRAGNANSPTLSGWCSACSPEGLQLDCALNAKQPDWPYRSIDIYFHTCKNEELIFHAFTAGIQRTAIRGDRLIVDMPLPASFRNEQKRALFRVAPSQFMIAALALWPMSVEQEILEETCGRALGRPMCAYRPQRVDQATVLDLSAGGVRLRLNAEHCRRLGAIPAPGDYFSMLAVFGNKQGLAEPRQFWFKCLCRHIGTHPDSKDPFVGLQFRAWSLTQKLTDPIVWNDMGDCGEVTPLFEWLMAYTREMPRMAGESSSCRIKL